MNLRHARLIETSYIFLCALSIVAINPWGGADRSAIWLVPKLVALILLVALNALVLLEEAGTATPETFRVPRAFFVFAGLWALFLACGCLSTLSSPFPFRSLVGHREMGDGLAYQVLLSVFAVSAALVSFRAPRHAVAQLRGFLIGGTVLALSIVPQVHDWRIDYTATSRLVDPAEPEMLQSNIWKDQMPIGLYSHRGHAAFALAFVALLALVALRNRRVRPAFALLALGAALVGLGLAQTRGAIVAFACGALYLFARLGLRKRVGRRFALRLGATLAVAVALIGLAIAAASSRHSIASSASRLMAFDTERPLYWKMSLQAARMRPLQGWGFDGFGIAYPWIFDCNAPEHKYQCPAGVPVRSILTLSDYGFQYLGTDNEEHTGILLSNKAHCLVLDLLLSVGLLGLLVFGALMGFVLRQALTAPAIGFEAILIAFLVFGLFWYETAQTSHLVWWAAAMSLAEALRSRVRA